MKTLFKNSYKQLNLSHSAAWNDVKTNYRKLVQIWHPDRYDESSPDYAVAHQNFLEITKAFEQLETFYRINGRLPLQAEQTSEANLENGKFESIDLSRKSAINSNRKRRMTPGRSVSKVPFIIGLLVVAFLLINSSNKQTHVNKPVTAINKAPDNSHSNVRWSKSLDHDINRGRYLGTSSTSVGDILNRRLQETRR